MANTALAELMALDFAIDELGLYLVTHAQDQEVLQLYWSYIKLANGGPGEIRKTLWASYTDHPDARGWLRVAERSLALGGRSW